MKVYNKSNKDLITHFINQTFKMLHLFEENDEYGYKHVLKTIQELEGLVIFMPEFANDYRTKLVLAKWHSLYDELYFKGEHQLVKNLTFESAKLLEAVGRDMY